jgi:hypothetical protein
MTLFLIVTVFDYTRGTTHIPSKGKAPEDGFRIGGLHSDLLRAHSSESDTLSGSNEHFVISVQPKIG